MLKATDEAVESMHRREDVKEQQGVHQPSWRITRTSQVRGDWTKFAIAQEVTELTKARARAGFVV